jgi:hypothetical protein
VNINVHQIHVGLQESGQFLGMVGLYEQEASSTTRQVVPSLDAFWMIGASFSLFMKLPFQSTSCIHSARFFIW